MTKPNTVIVLRNLGQNFKTVPVFCKTIRYVDDISSMENLLREYAEKFIEETLEQNQDFSKDNFTIHFIESD